MKSSLKIIFTTTPVFFSLLLSDLILRTAYQTGKSPALQYFALDIGVTTAFLGLIIAVSTTTGIFLKSLVGWCSDKTGRWVWIFAGLIFFLVVPFLYRFIQTPADLFILRLIHGIATAIYGPVSLAIVAEFSGSRKGEHFAWYGLARTLSYIIGPIAGGLLITVLSPVQLYDLIGAVSILSLIPIYYAHKHFPKNRYSKPNKPSRAIFRDLASASKSKAVLLIGLMEVHGKLAVYSVKAFIPVLMLSNGSSILEAGMYLSVQEFVNALSRPFIAPFIDRVNVKLIVSLGLGLVSLGLLTIFLSGETYMFWASALLIGLGHGIFSPAAQSFVAKTAPEDMLGASFGMVGSMKNLGKVAGPVISGFLAQSFELKTVFLIVALVPLILSLVLLSTCLRSAK